MIPLNLTWKNKWTKESVTFYRLHHFAPKERYHILTYFQCDFIEFETPFI